MRELFALLVERVGPDALERNVLVALLVALRVGPTTFVAPWIALRGTPPLLRAALLAVLVAALLPSALATAPEVPTTLLPLVLASLRELVLGTLIAVACALPLLALGESGRLVDALRGAQGESTGPGGERTSPLGAFQLLFASGLFLAVGGHRLVIGAMAGSLHTLPPGSAATNADALLELGRAIAASLTIAVAFAAPALLALVVADVSLGLVARSAPQIPVHFAGMPLRSAVGIAAVLLSLALVAPRLLELVRWSLSVVGLSGP